MFAFLELTASQTDGIRGDERLYLNLLEGRYLTFCLVELWFSRVAHWVAGLIAWSRVDEKVVS